jgi:hypothetical protein
MPTCRNRGCHLWVVWVVVALCGGEAGAASYQMASTNIAVNLLRTNANWTNAFLSSTPGQFRGAILPVRSRRGGWYQEVLRTAGYTWEQARADAQARGGRLATIRSEAENGEMLASLGPGSADQVWLGGTDVAVEGEWRWLDGDAFVFTRWNTADHEPNNWDGNEDGLALIRTGPYARLWNDRPLDATLGGYILEVESAPALVGAGAAGTTLFLAATTVGAPYVGKASEFLIGAVISPPTVDENGRVLDGIGMVPRPEEYWEPRPANWTHWNQADSANYGRFYYSPSKEAVFATAYGQATIQWVKRSSETPSASPPPADLWLDRGGVYHRILSRTYLISATAVKDPRRIYHTDGQNAQGIAVSVPKARIADVTVVYHRDFPEKVPAGQGTAAFGPGSAEPSGGTGSETRAEIRDTLYFSQSQSCLRAANREGRVFVELVGPRDPGTGRAEHLGFEIVDVIASVAPLESVGELGEELASPSAGAGDGRTLFPEVANVPDGSEFVLQHSRTGRASGGTLYAVRETRNANDLSVWWMGEGEQGLLWPEQLHRYELRWPTSASDYSHYLRPQVANRVEAEATAVVLPRANSPRIEYQDDEANPRADFTQDFRFYTHLDRDYPAHRTLLSYRSGNEIAFERVFSWLQTRLELVDGSGRSAWAGTVATNLGSGTWTTEGGRSEYRLGWTDRNVAPYLHAGGRVNVGDRLESPDGAPEDGKYVAGHIEVGEGSGSAPLSPGRRPDLYHVGAYKDPFVVGFEEAAKGAIIPVNSMPETNRNRLRVQWFRRNEVPPNAGFEHTYWPCILADYAVGWPHEEARWKASRDTVIVLASNDGSGPLPSLEAKGSIYFQNDPNLPGYNPNEEHALMIGGQAYALRDDLNLVSGPNYSSEPYVLVSYLDETSRPRVHAFRVLREDPADTFDFPVVAGTVIQPPMPLPLLPAPVPGSRMREYFLEETKGGSRLDRVLNRSIRPVSVAGSSFGGAGIGEWSLTQHATERWNQGNPWDRMLFAMYQPLHLRPPGAGSSLHFLGTRHVGPGECRGQVSELPIVRLAAPEAIDATTRKVVYRLGGRDDALLTNLAPNAVVVVASIWGRRAYSMTVESRSVDRTLTLVYAESEGGGSTSPTNVLKSGEALLLKPSAGFRAANALQGYVLSSAALPPVLPAADPLQVRYALPVLQDRKGNWWAYRGPHSDTDRSAAVQVHWFYRTQEGFWFPELAIQPAVGSLAPYLRPLGDSDVPPVVDESDTDPESFPVTYRIHWPDSAPELRPGQTLALPVFGLPAIRGNTSAQVVYEQSLATEERRSVTLFDPTREKTYAFGQAGGLARIPASIATIQERGRTFFPGLAPHLVERFYFDPNRGESGALVFRGEFRDEAVGEDYFLLNVAAGSDLAALRNLPTPAGERAEWGRAIDGLKAKVETYVEDKHRRGTYVSDGQPVDRGIGELVEIADDDTAVDSYALAANQPGHGYVSILLGDGEAFTPSEEPVSVQVIQVGGPPYRGEVKPITAANPLAEKLTVMHTADLAGATGQFEYEWRIAAPVDGAPPPVYEKSRLLLEVTNRWKHLGSLQDGESRANLPGAESPRWTEFGLGAPIVVLARAAASSLTYSNSADRAGQELEVGLADTQAFSAGDRVRLEGFVPVAVNGEYKVATVLDGALRFGREEDPGPLQTLGTVTEIASAGGAQSIVRGSFTLPPEPVDDVHLSFEVDGALGFRLWVDGAPAVVRGWPGEGDSPTVPAPYGFECLPRVYRLDSSRVRAGTHEILVELRGTSDPGASLVFDLRAEGNRWLDHPNLAGSQWRKRTDIAVDLRRIILGESADVQALSDNYLIVRYRATNLVHSTRFDDAGNRIEGWSKWTEPALAEGWIKRVLAGINPFNQRVGDLFAHRVDTTASILTQAGPRWEGDVALSLESIQDFGLIEIYETVMNRGRMLSVDAGINYGPANDALLLAAGYLGDLYMMLGNEAWADAANPTIGIGSKDGTYGSIATALFAFKGQLPSLIEEELALLRGRDDFLQPGTRTPPVYNRLFWNYTRGIDAGEVIYALNYNILEDNDQGVDGVINAEDARKMFPQGHGDAYGHYLTALKGYYRLLMSKDFTWVPRTEAVNILGKPVQVDYADERKFAAAAAAVARAGKQIVDLTWRRDYLPRASEDATGSWDASFAPKRGNAQTGLLRFWGVDHWAARVAQGALVNWVVGNAMVPALDPDPAHEGIQKIDRSTVPELMELPALMESLQVSMDHAEAGLNPLGLPEDTVPMDITPTVTSIEYFEDGYTHFEQVYRRALVALQNAGASFDDAKDVSLTLRSEQDTLAEFQTEVANQEMSYKHALVELYGTPYPDDLGPGKTYSADYDGPDFYHFMYVDPVDAALEKATHPTNRLEQRIDVQQYPAGWYASDKTDFGWITKGEYPGGGATDARAAGSGYITYVLDSEGIPVKPADWTGRRASPGEVQASLAAIAAAHNEVYEALKQHEALKYQLDRMIEVFENKVRSHEDVRDIKVGVQRARDALRWTKFTSDTLVDIIELASAFSEKGKEAARAALPKMTIAGTATGGHFTGPFEAAIIFGQAVEKNWTDTAKLALKATLTAFQNAFDTGSEHAELDYIAPLEWGDELRESVYALDMQLGNVQASLFTIYGKVQALASAYDAYRSAVAKGDRIQAEREVFRQRAAAVIQGYRTRDAALRIFRNEKLERYKTLQDTAARYAYLAARAYDYETGLLATDEGRRFLNRLVSSRALGVIRDGEPQYAGSSTGDPGLSGVLAEMKADFDVLRGRLGLNNPKLMGTTASLRVENWRILPTAEGDAAWHGVLLAGRTADVRDDPDVRRFCLAIDTGAEGPVPGIVLEFQTAIQPGVNLFGRRLASGDHAFEAGYFATKILSAGVALEGYLGMDTGAPGDTLVDAAGGQSPAGSLTEYLNPRGLAANPYVFLIPVGLDTMRSPPLGDESVVRTWRVEDVAIPLPFNIGASGFSTQPFWTSAESLTEPMFAIRKHPAFRPLASGADFSGTHDAVWEYATSNRLIGRSAWNSKWKLVIPGNRLLDDPEEGLNRFLATVKDIKIHFKTYSYAGN